MHARTDHKVMALKHCNPPWIEKSQTNLRVTFVAFIIVQSCGRGAEEGGGGTYDNILDTHRYGELQISDRELHCDRTLVQCGVHLYSICIFTSTRDLMLYCEVQTNASLLYIHLKKINKNV